MHYRAGKEPSRSFHVKLGHQRKDHIYDPRGHLRDCKIFAKVRFQLYYAVIYLSGLCSGDVRHPAAVCAELPRDGGGAVHGGHPQDPGRPPRLLDHLHPGGAQQTLHVRLLRHPQCGNVHSNVFYLEPPVGLQI